MATVAQLPIPQADDLSKVVQLLAIVAHRHGNPDKIAAELQLSQRQANYHTHAAELLGLIHRDGDRWRVTQAGQRLFGHDGSAVLRDRLISAVETSSVGTVFPSLVRAPDISMSDVVLALRQAAGLALSTAERRAKTLLSWRDFLRASAPLIQPARSVETTEPPVTNSSPGSLRMDFADRLQELAARIPSQLAHLQTEAATSTALVMPFIACLGFNVFNPTEVVPEFTADVGTKKGEKVDYAIMQGSQPIMLFEVKHHLVPLGRDQMSQLFRYFSVTEARIGVLTNGIEYRFFADLDAQNKMDERPFLEINMLDLKDPDIEALKRLTKMKFQVDDVIDAAGELKYTNGIKKVLGEETVAPSEDIVRYLTKRVYAGNVTKTVIDRFTPIVKRAFQQLIHDRIQERLQTAIAQDSGSAENAQQNQVVEPADELPPGVIAVDGDVVTTEDEVEAFRIVRAIMSKVVDASRVVMRDTKSYCGILLDDNSRKPVCRLRFGTRKLVVGVFDHEKNEEKIEISSVTEIYRLAERLMATASFYD